MMCTLREGGTAKHEENQINTQVAVPVTVNLSFPLSINNHLRRTMFIVIYRVVRELNEKIRSFVV